MIRATLVVLSLLSGCAVQKTLIATGGSRADGTVEMAYEVGEYEKPIIDYEAGRQTAKQRCAAWGYTDAEPFGGEKRLCQTSNSYGSCTSWLVTVQYQCTGKPSED